MTLKLSDKQIKRIAKQIKGQNLPIGWGLDDTDTERLINLIPEASTLIEKNEFGYYTRISRENFNKIVNVLKDYLPPGFDYEVSSWKDLDDIQYDAANTLRKMFEYM